MELLGESYGSRGRRDLGKNERKSSINWSWGEKKDRFGGEGEAKS